MKTLSMVLGCCLIIGCGAQDSGLEENNQGKAEDFSSLFDKPKDLKTGYGLTVGQDDTFKILKDEIQVFTIEVPEGTHAYSLTIKPTNEWSLFRYELQSYWTFVKEGEDQGAEVNALKNYLGSCHIGSITPCTYTGNVRQRSMNIFTGPGKVALALKLFDDEEYNYTIEINEIMEIESGESGMLVMGWTRNEKIGSGENYYHMDLDVDQIPFEGDVATLTQDTVLYSGPFEDAPKENASFLALEGTELRFGECFTIADGIDSFFNIINPFDSIYDTYLLACTVFAE